MIWVFLALSASALDLEETREAAALKSLEVQQAQARADAARARSGSALGTVLPGVVAFVDASAGAGFTSFGFERPVAWQIGAGLEGTWALVDPARWSAATAARRSSAGQQALLRWSLVEARRSSTIAYSAAWATAVEVELRIGLVADAEKGAEAVASLVEAGLRPPADRSRAEAAAARSAAELASARARAIDACARLNGLILEPITADCDIAEVEWSPVESAEGAHPALEAAREAWRSTKAARGAAWWDLGPAISLRGTVAEYASQGNPAGPGWSVGVRAEQPLVAVDEIAGAVAADADVREAEAAMEAQERALAIARVAAEAHYYAAGDALAALERADKAAREAHQLTDERYLAGLEGITAWLDARRQRDEAAVAVALGRAAIGVALADVEAARGVTGR